MADLLQLKAANGRNPATASSSVLRNSSGRFSPKAHLLCCSKCYQRTGIKPRQIQSAVWKCCGMRTSQTRKFKMSICLTGVLGGSQ